jgi:hypothetical protein
MASFSPKQVEDLAAALPPDGANPVGSNARRIIVNKIRGLTPGNFSQLFGTGPPFRVVFFPGYVPDAAEGIFASYTGVADSFFSNFAIAALCHRIYAVTSSLRQQMVNDQIEKDLNAWNIDLRGRVARWYSYVASITEGDIKKALAKFSDESSRAEARTHYKAGLTSESWINDKVTQGDFWTNREWELFHHWIKFAALGASDKEIDETIQTAINKGLPVPSAVGPGNWTRWTNWFGANITGADIADADKPILASRCSRTCLAEANSFEFTANSQPGTRYRRVPSSSCFAPGAQVVMADGSLKPIESVAAGDRVRSRAGEDREVVLLATPARGSRPLYQIAGTAFAFTATHPFLTYPGDTEPAYVAVDPAALSRAVPSLAEYGILTMGTAQLARHAGGAVEPFTPAAVDSVESPADVLYDLYVDPGSDGRSEYFVGDPSTQLLVSSEIPRFLTAPATSAAIVEILQRTAPTILKVLAGVSDAAYADLLYIGLDSVSSTLLPSIGKYLNPSGLANLKAPSQQESTTLIRSFANSFGGANGEPYNNRLGVLLDFFLARFGMQFQGVVRMGWRTFDLADSTGGMVLAVSLYGLELYNGKGIPASSAQFRLTLSLEDSVSVRTAPVAAAASNDHSFYVSDSVTYFPEWRALVEAPPGREWTLTITLEPKTGEQAAPFQAKVRLSQLIAHGFEFLRGYVTDNLGNTVGQVAFDIRALTPDAWTQEILAQRAWSPDQEPAIAHKLASLASEYILANFETAIREFSSVAATSEGRSALAGAS